MKHIQGDVDEKPVPREFVSHSKTDSRHLFSTHEFSSMSLVPVLKNNIVFHYRTGKFYPQRDQCRCLFAGLHLRIEGEPFLF
jgi:hypothetical protein